MCGIFYKLLKISQRNYFLRLKQFGNKIAFHNNHKLKTLQTNFCISPQSILEFIRYKQTTHNFQYHLITNNSYFTKTETNSLSLMEFIQFSNKLTVEIQSTLVRATVSINK